MLMGLTLKTISLAKMRADSCGIPWIFQRMAASATMASLMVLDTSFSVAAYARYFALQCSSRFGLPPRISLVNSGGLLLDAWVFLLIFLEELFIIFTFKKYCVQINCKNQPKKINNLRYLGAPHGITVLLFATLYPKNCINLNQKFSIIFWP